MNTRVESWFDSRGWKVFPFQRKAWRAYLDRRSGLVHAPTGTGKTYAALLGPMIEALDKPDQSDPEPIRLLWMTPLRALAADTLEAIRAAIDALDLPWTAELRTGDTSSSIKARQRKRLPTALVTTPESLTILLSYEDSSRALRSVRCVVADEWHELMSTKRGVQAELALARLRALAPNLRTWGLSATLGNIEQAARALAGAHADPVIIRARSPKRIVVDAVIPEHIDRYPWAGHLGTRLVHAVADAIEAHDTTLLFTNTRSQAEIWFRELMRARPALVGAIALHHGSLDRDIRTDVESLLRGRDGRSTLRCVVSTSSLDLGVDFSPVQQVIQVGSPKGVARLIQRAGRSGHRPGAPSRILCVPSHAFELVEIAAVRDAIAQGELEARPALRKPLDVLAQHLVTASMAGGFDEQTLKAEVRTTHAFQDLTDLEWSWAMDFVRRGGPALNAYPRFMRISPDGELWRVASRAVASRHRMAIGTIVGDTAVRVQYLSGRTLGTIEESFIARLRAGDRFVFSGRVLEFVRLREMTAFVRRARSTRAVVPRWNGGKMPLSSQLARAVRQRLSLAADGVYDAPEMAAVRPLLELQRALSRIPEPDELLIERLRSRAGHHAFLFPFAGRLAHEGLGAVLSLRLTRAAPMSVTASATDYGIELRSDADFAPDEAAWRAVLSTDRLLEDLLEAANATELARRQFREVARIAGLTQTGYPGETRSARALQASSEMFFDALTRFDPDNMLLGQARREVLEAQLEFRRLHDALLALAHARITIIRPDTLTPLSFPLWAETLRATTVSSAAWEDRVRSMVLSLESGAAAARA